MKVTIQRPYDIHIDNPKYEYKKGEPFTVCGLQCEKNIKYGFDSAPECQIFKEKLFLMAKDNITVPMRCEACIKATDGKNYAEKTVVDVDIFAHYLLKTFNGRKRWKTVRPLAEKIVKSNGRINMHTLRKYIKNYDVDLEKVWNDYFENRKWAYR